MIQFRVPQKSCFSGSFLLKIASHGQTVHFRLYSVIHNRKALVISFHMVFFKNFNVDPARRQIFGNALAEKCIPVLRVRLVLFVQLLLIGVSKLFLTTLATFTCFLHVL